MSTTSDYLSRKIGDLGCEIAANRNQAKRLDLEHERMAVELREVEAAYAAVEALDAEHEHRWIDQADYDKTTNSARRWQSCTVDGCPAVLEVKA
jgi:hypothetical protein